MKYRLSFKSSDTTVMRHPRASIPTVGIVPRKTRGIHIHPFIYTYINISILVLISYFGMIKRARYPKHIMDAKFEKRWNRKQNQTKGKWRGDFVNPDLMHKIAGWLWKKSRFFEWNAQISLPSRNKTYCVFLYSLGKTVPYFFQIKDFWLII